MRSIMMQGILQYLAFKQFFEKNPQLKNFFYLSEFQAWEKAMLMAQKSFLPGLKSIGFQHAAISTNYFNYFYEKSEATPSPDLFLTNCPWLQPAFEKFLPRVVLVEALRQNYLSPLVEKKFSPGVRANFAVFSSLSASNTLSLLQFLKQAFDKKNPPFKIVVKLHPSLNLDVKPYLSSSMTLSQQPAAEILAQSFGCIVPDSTVALEGLAFGVPCLTPLFCDDITLSPVLDFLELGGVVSHPSDLEVQVNALYENQSHIDHQMLKNQLQKIWKLDPNMPAWKNIMKDNLI